MSITLVQEAKIRHSQGETPSADLWLLPTEAPHVNTYALYMNYAMHVHTHALHTHVHTHTHAIH